MKNITTLLILSYCFVINAQTQITNSNFQVAINTCLTTNPVDGMCSDSEYGAMPDWDVSNVTNMSEAFKTKTTFNGDISAWDVSNVTDMREMFNNAIVFNQPIGNWNVSSVTDMQWMFVGTEDFNQDIGNWDVSSVTDMGGMFQFSALSNQDVGNWDVSSVTDMSAMFLAAVDFNQDIGNWDVSSVTDMQLMFGEIDFNQDIGNWDVSNVTDMSGMFLAAEDFNQDIGNWDVSSVTDMSGMFYEASSFNQNISNWCVTNIVSEPTDFSFNSPLSESNKPVWGTCPSLVIADQNLTNISIYPNPTEKYLFIEGNKNPVSVSIYNLLGAVVIATSATDKINVSELSKGIYIIRISDGIVQADKKFIKN